MFPPQVWAQERPPVVVPPTLVGPNTAPNSEAQAEAADPEAKAELKPVPEQKATTAVVRPPVVRKDRQPLRQAYHLAAWKVGYLLRRRLSTFVALRFNEDFAYFQPYAHCGSPFEKEGSLTEAVAALKAAQEKFGQFLKNREAEIGTVAIVTPDKRAKDEVVSNGKRCQPYFASEMRLTPDEGRSSELTDKLLSDLYGAGKKFLEPPMLDLLTIADEATTSTLEIRRYLELTDKLRRFANSLLTHAKTFNLAEGISSLPDLVISPELGEKLFRINGDQPYRVAAEKTKESGYSKIQAFHADEYTPRFVKCSEKATACGIGKDSKTDANQFCFCDSKAERVAQMDEDILLALQPQNPDEPTKRPHSVYLEGMRKLGIKGALVQLAGVNSSLRSEWKFEVPAVCTNSPAVKDYIDLYNDIVSLPEREYWIGNLKKAVADYQKDLKEGRADLPVPSVQGFRSFYVEANRVIDQLLKHVGTRYQVPQTAINAVKTMAGLLPFESRVTEGDRTKGLDLSALFGDKLVVWSLLIQTELSQLTDAEWRTKNALVAEMVKQVLISTYSDALFTYLTVIADGPIPEVNGNSPVAIAWKEKFYLQWENYLNSQVFSRYLDDALVQSITDRLLKHPSFDKPFDQNEQAEKLAEARAKEMLPLADAAVVADEAAQYQAMNEYRQGAPSALPGTDGVLGYVNPFNALNYYYQEGQFKNVTEAPACFQVPDGTGREGMYSQFKLNPLYNYNERSGEIDPTTEFDYAVVKGGLQSVIARETDKLKKQLEAKGYTDSTLRTSFSQEVSQSDGSTKTVRVENTKVLSAAILKKMAETLEADPSKDRSLVQSARAKSLGLIRAWYLNSDASRKYYESKVVKSAGIIFEKNLRSVLELKPEKANADWTRAFGSLLERIADEELLIVKMTPEKVQQILSDYELFAMEEKQLEALDKVLTEINDLEKSVLRKNQAIDSAAKWVEFCLKLDKEAKSCLAWFDETLAPILNSEYLEKYFEQKAEFEGEQILSGSPAQPGFVHYFGAKKDRYEGEKTIEELKKASTPKPVSSLEKITIAMTERSIENGKEVFKPIKVDAFYDESVEVPKGFKGPWFIVTRSKGPNANKISVLAPASVRISTTFEKFPQLRAHLWLADGVDAKNQWINGRKDTTAVSLVGLVALIATGTENLPLTGDALVAKQKLDSILMARRGLLRDAFWGYDISEFEMQILLTKYVRFSHHTRSLRGNLPTDEEYLKTLETNAETLAALKSSIPNPLSVDPNTREWDVPNDHLKEIDTFLVELSQRLHAKENEKKSSVEIARGVRHHVRKFFKDKSIANSWKGTFEKAKTAIQNAINAEEAKRSEELASVFPHVRYLFHYLPLYLTRRGQNPGTPAWAKEKYYPILADALFPTYEQFVVELKNRIDKVALSQVDPIAEIKAINDELNTIRMSIWQLSQKEYGFGPMASAEKRSDHKALEKAQERLKTLEERRISLRAVRDAYSDLDKLLVHYLGDLEIAQEARQGLAKVNEPGLWNAYFEDQFLNSRTDEWGRPLVLTPNQFISDLNEVAKSSAPLLEVNPQTALYFLDDVTRVCETSRSAPFANTVNNNYFHSLVSMVTKLVSLSTLDVRTKTQESELGELKARLEMLWNLGRKEPGLLGLWQKNGQFIAWYEALIAQIKSVTPPMMMTNAKAKPAKKLTVQDFINPGKTPKEDKEVPKGAWDSFTNVVSSLNPIPALKTTGNAVPHSIVGALEASQFPKLTDSCEALEARAQKLKAEIAGEVEATTLSKAKAQKYLEEIVTPVTAIWLQSDTNLGPIYINSETDATKRVVWFRQGPVNFKAVGGEPAKSEGSRAKITRTLGEFFGQNHLKAKELEAIFKDSKDAVAETLKKENAPERVALINRLSDRERQALHARLQNYLESILLERESAEETAYSSEEFADALTIPGLTPPGEKAEAKTAEAKTAEAKKVEPAKKQADSSSAPKASPAIKPAAKPATKPANVAAQPAKPANAATAPATAATPSVGAPVTVVPVLPQATVVPAYASLFPERKVEGSSYESWKDQFEAYISLWEDFKVAKSSPLSGAPDSYDASAALYWLSDAIVAHFIKHTPYEIYRAKVTVPRHDGQSAMSVYGGPVSRDSKEMSLAQFSEYKNAQRIAVVEDIISLYRAEQVRILKELVAARAEKVRDEQLVGIYVAEQPEVKASEIRPFEKGALAFEPSKEMVNETSELRFLSFYARHFSSYEASMDADKNEAVSVASWQKFADSRYETGDSVVRLASDESKQFFWRWEPRGRNYKKFASLGRFNEWLERLVADPKANEAYAAKAKTSSTRPRVWNRFRTLDEVKGSTLVAEIKKLIALADAQAKVTTDAQTYPYFLALLNWNINRYGVVPKLDTNHQVLKDRYLVGLTREVVELIGWDLKHYNGWERILKERGTVQDWKSMAERKRDFMIGIKSRAMLLTSVEATFVENPEWGVSYGYRPTPVHPGERTLSLPFKTAEEYRQWLSHPQEYLRYRVNGDNVERALYKQLASLKGEMTGEWHLQNQNPNARGTLHRANSDAATYTFGVAGTKVPASRLAELGKRAQTLGIETSEGDLRRIIGIREKWLDFRRQVDELRRGYDFEGAQLFAGRNNSMVNAPGSAAAKVTLQSAAGQLNTLLERYAAQLGYPESVSIDFALWRDNYSLNALFQADKIAEWAMYEGQGDRSRIAKVMAMLDGYYQEKNTGFEMQKGVFQIGKNIVGRLEKLCQLDVSGINNDQQLEEAVHKHSRLLGVAYWEEDGGLTQSELLYMDGLLETINEALPEGENSETYRRLVELKSRKGLWQGRWEKWGQPVANVAMVAILGYLFMGKNPTGRLGMGATGVNYLINLTFAASFLWEVGREIDQMYIGGPNRLETLTRIRDTRIDDYLNLMRDESGLSLAGQERALEEHRNSYLWWGVRVWMTVSAFEMAGINVRNLRGGWNAAVRWLRPEYYARKERAWVLKELGLTEQQFKNSEELAKRLGELLPVIEKKTAERFAKVLNGYAVDGDVIIPKDIAAAYERWIESKLYWIRNNEAAAESVARLEAALAEVRTSTPFLSKDSLQFLHAQGNGAYVELMPTWMKFITHEDIYSVFVNTSTSIGRATGVKGLIRPAGLLSKAGNVGLAEQRLRQLLLFERMRVWQPAANETLKPMLRDLFGADDAEAMKAFLRASADPKHELQPKIQEFAQARWTPRETSSGGLGTAQAVDEAENQARALMTRDILEIQDFWNMSGINPVSNPKEFETMVNAIADGDFRTIAYTLTAPNRMMSYAPSLLAHEEKAPGTAVAPAGATHVAGGEPSEFVVGGVIAHLPDGRVWTTAAQESIALDNGLLKTATEIGQRTLKNVAGPLSPQVQKILDLKLSSDAIGHRAGMLKMHNLLDEEGQKVYRMAYEMTRAMELGQKQMFQWTNRRAPISAYEELFEPLFQNIVGKSNSAELSLAEAMGAMVETQTQNPALMQKAKACFDRYQAILSGKNNLTMDDLAFVLGVEKPVLSQSRVWSTLERDLTNPDAFGFYLLGRKVGGPFTAYREQLRALVEEKPLLSQAEKLLNAAAGSDEAIIKANAQKLREEVRAIAPEYRFPGGDRFTQMENTINESERLLLTAPPPKSAAAPETPIAPQPNGGVPQKRGFSKKAPELAPGEAKPTTEKPAASTEVPAVNGAPKSGKRGFSTQAPSLQQGAKPAAHEAPALVVDYQGGIPRYQAPSQQGQTELKPYLDAGHVHAATLKKLESGQSISALLAETEAARGLQKAGTEAYESLSKQITELRLIQGAQWLESAVEAGVVKPGSPDYDALKELFLQRYVRSPLEDFLSPLTQTETLLQTRGLLGIENPLAGSMPWWVLLDEQLVTRPQVLGYFLQSEQRAAEATTTKFLEVFGRTPAKISLNDEDALRIAKAIHDLQEAVNKAEEMAYEAGGRSKSFVKQIGELRSGLTTAHYRARLQFGVGNDKFPKFVEAFEVPETQGAAQEGKKIILPSDLQ